MKYIKTYENKEDYKVGDWIILVDVFNDNGKIIEPFKIIKIDHKWTNPYRLQHYLDNGKESFFNLQKIYIKRLATPEEIENQEAKISALKYNL